VLLALLAAFSLAVDTFRLKPGCPCIGPSLHSLARVDRSVRDVRDCQAIAQAERKRPERETSCPVLADPKRVFAPQL